MVHHPKRVILWKLLNKFQVFSWSVSVCMLNLCVPSIGQLGVDWVSLHNLGQLLFWSKPSYELLFLYFRVYPWYLALCIGREVHSVATSAELYHTTRSVFANDKFVKLMQDVTLQRKIFEKWDYASLNIFLNFNIPSFQKREGLFLNFKRIVCLNI